MIKVLDDNKLQEEVEDILHLKKMQSKNETKKLKAKLSALSENEDAAKDDGTKSKQDAMSSSTFARGGQILVSGHSDEEDNDDFGTMVIEDDVP